MSNIKISELPVYTGSVANTWFVVDNPSLTQTSRIIREDFINGTSGTSGTSGFNGANGTSGTSGSSGSSGIGTPGSSGSSGTSGLNGTNGSSGSSGTSGSSGSNGSSGSSGTSGSNGSSGSSGTSGTNGSSGTSGTSGSSGSSGSSGTSGSSGSSGSSGTSGTSGTSFSLTGSFLNGVLTYNGFDTSVSVQNNISYTSSSLYLTGSGLISGSIGLIGNQSITGSLNVNGNQNFTGSFRITGSEVITGSLTVSGSATFIGTITTNGSVLGNVSELTITSNTASLDCSKANFFLLRVPNNSSCNLSAINIKSGQTINMLVVPTGSCTMSYDPEIKQPGGYAYQPNDQGHKDVLTLVSFDNQDLYMVDIKNFV